MWELFSSFMCGESWGHTQGGSLGGECSACPLAQCFVFLKTGSHHVATVVLKLWAETVLHPVSHVASTTGMFHHTYLFSAH